jgi:hypothetical protein
MNHAKPHRYVNAVAETIFPVHGKILEGNTTTELFAETPRIADELMKERHMGEKLEPIATILGTSIPDLPSELYEAGRIHEALHAACWLGMIACKSGVVKGEELLDDNGVIHNLSHLALPKHIVDAQNQDYMNKIRKNILPMLKELEAKTPGFHKYLTKEELLKYNHDK